MPLCAPPKFKILVANIDGASDPSIGEAGNPVKNRTAFVLQQMILPDGTTRIGGPTQSPPAPSSVSHTAAIQVVSNTFWDPSVATPPPFYQKEEVQIGDRFLTASEEFGAGLGSAAGTLAEIASSLATAMSTIPGVQAVASGDFVYITSTRTDGYLPVKASNDTATIFSGYDFHVLGPNGEVLTVVPNDRRTYYIVKPVKSQSPPTILP